MIQPVMETITLLGSTESGPKTMPVNPVEGNAEHGSISPVDSINTITEGTNNESMGCGMTDNDKISLKSDISCESYKSRKRTSYCMHQSVGESRDVNSANTQASLQQAIKIELDNEKSSVKKIECSILEQREDSSSKLLDITEEPIPMIKKRRPGGLPLGFVPTVCSDEGNIDVYHKTAPQLQAGTQSGKSETNTLLDNSVMNNYQHAVGAKVSCSYLPDVTLIDRPDCNVRGSSESEEFMYPRCIQNYNPYFNMDRHRLSVTKDSNMTSANVGCETGMIDRFGSQQRQQFYDDSSISEDQRDRRKVGVVLGRISAPINGFDRNQHRVLPYVSTPQSSLSNLLDGLVTDEVYNHIEAAFGISNEWRSVLMPILCSHEGIRAIREYERRCGYENVLPVRMDVFSWSRYCRPKDVKVIILGQDPYHRVGQAHGLAFSVIRGTAIPPSLNNIMTAVKRCYPGAKIRGHGNLEYWASQGVLLLNSVLTVKEGEPGSHIAVGWTPLVRAILRHFEYGASGMVYMLWGAQAQRLYTPHTSRHLILKYSHPSPLSRRPFGDCRHFFIANEYLCSLGKGQIDWSVP